MEKYLRLGQKIYKNNRLSDYRRMMVFMIRSIINQDIMINLKDFFEKNSMRKDIINAHPYIFEQVTRCVFYRGSTFNERFHLIKENFLFFEKIFTKEALKLMYLGKGIQLWNGDYHGEPIALQLDFNAHQKKEGLMGITLTVGQKEIYYIIFWVAPDKKGKMTIWIGALQGSKRGLDIARDLTKEFAGYRPKNLIVQALRSVACQLRIDRIHAISNYGFYANNHIRINRKLKTSLDDFWKEIGGRICKDRRFYELPVVESRKKLEDVQSKKRNLYRKRFAVIDRIDGEIKKTLKLFLKWS